MTRSERDIENELLVIRAQEGCREAFGSLIATWHSRLFRHAKQITGTIEGSKDVMQEAWMAIVKNIRSLDDAAKFRSWAYRIVHNKSINWVRGEIRRRNMKQKIQTVVATTSHTEKPYREDEVDRLKVMLRRLPTQQQTLLRLVYTEQMSLQEISQVLGVRVGTLKYRLFQLRQLLREELSKGD